jgi:transcriptional regulator with XRE-family HTH domain
VLAMGDDQRLMRLDGPRLRYLREQRGFSQVQCAARASISKSYLSMLERGERRFVSPGVAARLAQTLDVAIVDISFQTARIRKPQEPPG